MLGELHDCPSCGNVKEALSLEAVAQTPVLPGFVVRGGIDDSPSILSTRR